MNKVLILSVLISIAGHSCSTGQKENNSGKETVEKTQVTENKENNIILPSDSGIIKLTLVNGKASVTTQKEKDQTIYLKFESEGYKKITAHLSSPDSTANIRFSQIFMPDGTMDGPFGRDLNYDLPMDGLYKISIHESLMAGDPWSGILKAEIELLK